MYNYSYYFLMNILCFIILLILILVGIAFLTLLERKMLGLIQLRKGPNKVGIIGIFQPFSDAIKLFSKELFLIYKSNFILFYFCPLVSFMLMMMMWMIIVWDTNMYFMNYSMLLMIILMSLSSYILLLSGWSSNSVFSLLGSLRAVSQVLSYEVSFMLILMVFMILSESYSLVELEKWQYYVWNMWFLIPMFIIFFISILAELNRSPMDFIEGESELVSGFNIEYFSGGFAMIFLAEYGMIIFFSMILMFMFIGGGLKFFCSIYLNMFCSIIIIIRGMLPRMRYDELMYLCWKIILPLILSYLLFYMGFKFMNFLV